MKNSPRGSVLLLSLVFLGIISAVSSAYLFFITSSARSVRHNIENAQALALAEAGVDAAIHRMNQEAGYSGETALLGTGKFVVSVSDVNGSTKKITATGFIPSEESARAQKTVVVLANINSSIISFRFGVQVGEGGVSIGNNAKVNGNLYSGGSVTGSGEVVGDAVAAGELSAISTTVEGTARAHSLVNCAVSGDAYYQTISNCPVTGTKYPNSNDPAVETMPISNEQIQAWEEVAIEGESKSGNYTISGSETLGPTVINGNLTVSGTLTLSGVVWVKGNITFANNSKLLVSSSTGNEGAIIIADVPGNESVKGVVTLGNGMDISGNGAPGSLPMVISTHYGSTAITLNNNAESIILYASRGTVSVENGAKAKQVTAYGLSIKNNAEINYTSGLQSQSFSNGPGGSWMIIPRTYGAR